jgi:hypothetical protein
MMHEIVFGCAIATSLGFCMNGFIQTRHRSLGAHAGKSSKPVASPFEQVMFRDILSAPVWAYFFSLALQCSIYPLCISISWAAWRRSARVDLSARWMDAPGGLFPDDDGLEYIGLRLVLYCFFGQLARDIPMCRDDTLMVLHHSISLLGILVVLHTPEAGVNTVLGMFALEEGSALYNCWALDQTMRMLPSWFPCWPKGRTIVPLVYKVGFTLTDIIGGWALMRTIYANANHGHWGFAIFYAVTGLPILILRQKACIDQCTTGSSLTLVSAQRFEGLPCTSRASNQR